MDLMVEATPRRVFANAHTYHINSISVNSDCETYMSADDLRINLWNLEITNRSFNIVDIKPANMEELTEVITAAEFHPNQCNTFVYSSSKGTIRLCDMRAMALCDKHSKCVRQLTKTSFEIRKDENGLEYVCLAYNEDTNSPQDQASASITAAPLPSSVPFETPPIIVLRPLVISEMPLSMQKFTINGPVQFIFNM
ncbi:UNVERIFIED_CONTAM: hypothetical protein FKN15_022549 [Acipenser sinensis]